MDLDISFKHMDTSDAVRDYASEKSEKLTKFFQGKIHVYWNFEVSKQNHIAHCHMVGNNMDYFGQGETQDMYASIDVAVDKVEKQLRKHKEMVKDHLHRNGDRTPVGDGATGV